MSYKTRNDKLMKNCYTLWSDAMDRWIIHKNNCMAFYMNEGYPDVPKWHKEDDPEDEDKFNLTYGLFNSLSENDYRGYIITKKQWKDFYKEIKENYKANKNKTTIGYNPKDAYVCRIGDVAFNSKLFDEVVNVLDSANITIYVEKPNHPIFVESTNGIALLMPIFRNSGHDNFKEFVVE